MPLILHCISAYPDPIAPETSASSLLLELAAAQAPDLVHKVYSFKRSGPIGGQAVVAFDDPAGQGHRAIAYSAPPKGLLFQHYLDKLADWIIEDATARGLVPDAVHAHKVSLDGLVGQKVAAHFGVPLIVTVQANSDQSIIKAKPNLRARHKALWHDAKAAFVFAPNANDAMVDLLGARTGGVTLLPCPTRADTISAPYMRAEGEAPVIRTAFNIGFWKNKNVETLIKAVAQAASHVPDISLEIIGGGSQSDFLKVAQMADKLAPGRVRLLGARPLTEMQGLLHTATAFALLSHRESYGMVFAEALLAGTPCLYPAGRAIDGIFTEGEFTLSASPKDLDAIASALIKLCTEEAAFKTRLAAAQKAGDLAKLQRDTITRTYLDTTQAVLDAKAP